MTQISTETMRAENKPHAHNACDEIAFFRRMLADRMSRKGLDEGSIMLVRCIAVARAAARNSK